LRQRQFARIDHALVRLQRPVAAQAGRAGQVGRGRHVGARGPGDAVQQPRAAAAGGHVAAVQQQVAVGRQRAAEPGQFGLRGRRRQRAFRELRGAQVDHALRAVREDVDRVQPALRGGPLRDLREAVAAAVELDDAHAVAHARFQRLVVGQRGVHQHHLLLALVLRGFGGAHLHGRRHRRRRRAVVRALRGVGCVGDGAVEHEALLQRQQLRGRAQRTARGKGAGGQAKGRGRRRVHVRFPERAQRGAWLLDR
jgi:hypothetical protein